MSCLRASLRRVRLSSVLAKPGRTEPALVWLLTAVQFTLVLDFMLLMPMGPQLMQQMGLSITGIGLAVSVYTWCSALAGFTGPLWISRVSTTDALPVLYGGFVVATVCCGLSTSPAALLLARAVAGGAAGLVWSLVLATVVERIARERRGRALGAIMTSYAMSTILGVPSGLFLAQRYGCKVPFLGLAVLSTLLLVLLLQLLRSVESSAQASETDATLNRARELLSPPLALGWILTFLVVFSGFLLIPYLGLHLEVNWGMRREEVALIYACGGLCSLVSSRVIGWASDRFGAARTLGVLMGTTLATHTAMSQVQSSSKLVAILLFVAFMTSTSGRMIPVIDLLSEAVPSRLRTAYLAVNTGMTDVSAGLAAMAAGHLLGGQADGLPQRFAALGYGSMFVTCVGLALLAGVVRLRKSQPECEIAR